MNNQGEIVNRPSQIYFDGEVKDDYFDIKIGGQSQFVASGNGNK
jgi:trans-2,3-dihydro-3-hydroxyanthranilate isomerase